MAPRERKRDGNSFMESEIEMKVMVQRWLQEMEAIANREGGSCCETSKRVPVLVRFRAWVRHGFGKPG